MATNNFSKNPGEFTVNSILEKDPIIYALQHWVILLISPDLRYPIVETKNSEIFLKTLLNNVLKIDTTDTITTFDPEPTPPSRQSKTKSIKGKKLQDVWTKDETLFKELIDKLMEVSELTNQPFVTEDSTGYLWTNIKGSKIMLASLFLKLREESCIKYLLSIDLAIVALNTFSNIKTIDKRNFNGLMPTKFVDLFKDIINFPSLTTKHKKSPL